MFRQSPVAVSWRYGIELSVGPSFEPGVGSTKKHSCKCLVRAADQSTDHFHGEWEGPRWGGWSTPAEQEGFLESLERWGGGGNTRVNLKGWGRSQTVPTFLLFLLLFHLLALFLQLECTLPLAMKAFQSLKSQRSCPLPSRSRASAQSKLIFPPREFPHHPLYLQRAHISSRQVMQTFVGLALSPHTPFDIFWEFIFLSKTY